MKTMTNSEHSPLGGSGAARWMACPGSVQLSYGIEDPESDYTKLGLAAHALAENCLLTDADAWQHIGREYESVSVDKPMADAVQVYLNAIRSRYKKFYLGGDTWVELEFNCLALHKYFWGKADFVFCDLKTYTLHVWDYKHGAGVVIEATNNSQLMYYACGVLQRFNMWDYIDYVTLYIAQPRGFHYDGPIRSWTISVDALEQWLHKKLIPAMDRALVSRDTKSGEHCRFCPARSHACPQLLKDFDELEKLIMAFDEKNSAAELTNEQLGRFLDLYDVAKIAAKAANKTAFERLMAGKRVPGRKLVKARANREWKDGAELALRKKFGIHAFTQPEIKSPAKIEELAGGEQMTARYAYKPDKGLTVARGDDARSVVDKDLKKLFTDQTKGKK